MCGILFQHSDHYILDAAVVGLHNNYRGDVLAEQADGSTSEEDMEHVDNLFCGEIDN